MESSGDLESIAADMNVWFADAKWVGLVLPDGWFGRPYDNYHQVTGCTAQDEQLIVELDGRQVLTIDRPGEAGSTPTDLIVSGFRELTFEWTGYGSDGQAHTQTYSEGVLTFKNHSAR